ncbi:hypothetical protein BV22DRAFT_1097614 [Leucogyrophana mollusca]|uniref:Uncharacterized protein n=1 Tax=Leucogyrophana mollusca TaxID=85980 RepID=A0ACB8B4U6_9AGAM|nr:hypothetical protein BV22DRAFT_1097614 [Leucogyrophana mollusca]
MSAKHSPLPHTEQPLPHSALYRVDLSNSLAQSHYAHTALSTVVHRHPMDDHSSSTSRSFYPYIPNEVKHRKRTTPEQLKSLEEVFAKDTKPNGTLRKSLAQQLGMSARGVQVWFQNRRAKEKQHTRKAHIIIASKNSTVQGAQKASSPRDESPNDSSNSSTATEKAMPQAEAIPSTSADSGAFDHPSSAESSPPPKMAPLSAGEPVNSPWQSSPVSPADLPPQTRPQLLELSLKDSDLLNARRGSLPVMYAHPAVSSEMGQPPAHFERRQSLDASLYRLTQHPFAPHAKERNSLYLPRSPLSSPNQPMAPMGVNSPGVGPIRTASHGPSAYGRPGLMHRASMPHVFAASRPGVAPESGHHFVPTNSRRFSENPLYAPSRTVPSPIPGPLPSPNFSFGAPLSASPSIASPPSGDYDNVQSPDQGHVPSPDHTQQSDIAAMHRWSFPRGTGDDHDTEDSASYSGLSRFGSVTSIAGSESSALYSDVSSAAAFDPHGRRGSCASGHFLERGMSDLNMNSRSSQGSLNEAHMNAATSLAARPSHQKTMARPDGGGYRSPSSTISPGSSPHVQEGGPSSLRTGEVPYGYNHLVAARRGSEAYLSPREPPISGRRSSGPVTESIPEIYIENSLDPAPHQFPPSPAEPSNKYHFGADMGHFSHTGHYAPQPPFASDGAYPPGNHSFTASLQFNTEGHSLHAVPPPDPIGMHHSISPYAQAPNDYSYSASQPAKGVTGGSKPFNAYT